MQAAAKKEVPTQVLGVTLDEKALEALRDGKETELIKGFISQKSGKPFDAFIKLGPASQIKFRFPNNERKSSPFKNDKVPTSVGGVELDEEDIEDLKAGRETKLIMGISSKKNTSKTYDAYLKWTEKLGLRFRFPGQD